MLKQILVVVGGLALVVSIPLVALAMATDRTPPLSDSVVVTADDAPQPMTQQRLRVHAETGPTEGFEPARQRLHQPEAWGEGHQQMTHRQSTDAKVGGSMHRKNSVAPGAGPGDRQRGNQVGSCDGDAGECSNSADPGGAAHGRADGAGAPRQGGRGSG